MHRKSKKKIAYKILIENIKIIQSFNFYLRHVQICVFELYNSSIYIKYYYYSKQQKRRKINR